MMIRGRDRLLGVICGGGVLKGGSLWSLGGHLRECDRRVSAIGSKTTRHFGVIVESGVSSELREFLKRKKGSYYELIKAERNGHGTGSAMELASASNVKDFVRLIEAYDGVLEDMEGYKGLLADSTCDKDLKSEIESEVVECQIRLSELESEILGELVPEDEDDDRNAILEFRPGTGGLEAGLFAMDVLKMYKNYADQNGWNFEILTMTENEFDGLRESTALVKGRGAFGRLRYEVGVHRVQRVPETESLGRVHTSTMTVAVLPEAGDVDVQLRPQDLRIDTKRASGAGGQHVNTTESAVRIVHLPTNIIVTIQDERSQHQNKEKALKILKARVYEHERSRAVRERDEKRRSQIGTGDRSERIRTYNFPQDRVTDHRINKSVHGISEMFNGDYLDEFIDELKAKHRRERIGQLFGRD